MLCRRSSFGILTPRPLDPVLGPVLGPARGGGYITGVWRRVERRKDSSNILPFSQPSGSQWANGLAAYRATMPSSGPSQKRDSGENGKLHCELSRACLVFSRSRTSDCIGTSGRYGTHRGRGSGGGYSPVSVCMTRMPVCMPVRVCMCICASDVRVCQ